MITVIKKFWKIYCHYWWSRGLLRSFFFFLICISGCTRSSLAWGLFSSCGEQGLLSSYCVWASCCGGFSCGPRALGHMGFSNRSTQAQFSRSVVSDSLQPHEPQHARPPCPSPISGVHPNPCPLSRWCHPTISSSVVPFSSCPQAQQWRFVGPRACELQ